MTLDWERWYREGVTYRQLDEPVLDDLLSTITDKRGDKIRTALDVGCGAGELAGQLSRRGIATTGIDGSTAAIVRAQANTAHITLEHRPTFLVADINDLANNPTVTRYDTIWNKLVIAFIEERQRFFRSLGAHMNEYGWCVTISPVLTDDNRELVTPKLKAISVDRKSLLTDLHQVFATTITWRLADMRDHGSLGIFVSGERRT